MPTKPYDNKEYIDWVREGKLAEDTVAEGSDLVTLPTKMNIRDFALLIFGVFDSAQVVLEYSPDEMETPEAELIPATMRWFSRTDGIWTADNLVAQTLWENVQAAEGWIRFKIIGATVNTNFGIKTRPRVSAVI